MRRIVTLTQSCIGRCFPVMGGMRHVGRSLPLLVCFLIIGSGRSSANTNESETSRLCDQAARVAAQTQGIPLDVMKSISRLETGRLGELGLEPWPWTVNLEGAGQWFSSEDDARAFVFRHFEKGSRDFDVGCFQINYRWHGTEFRSIDEMFDPVSNAQYAAKFLRQLYAEFGNWPAAAGAYHSRTPGISDDYTSRFEEIRSRIFLASELSVPTEKNTAGNSPGRGRGLMISLGQVPLIGRGTATLGSLVPTLRTPRGSTDALVDLN